MSLVQHLEDSAVVAGWLWDNWLPPNVRRAISQSLTGGEADGRVLCSWIAGTHDIGKASPSFAAKAAYVNGFGGLLRDMAAHELKVRAPDPNAPPHCRVGQFLMERWLTERGFGPEAATYAMAVGGHHGVQPTVAELRALMGSPAIGLSAQWVAVQEEILTGMAQRTGALDHLSDWQGIQLPLTAQALLTGVVVVADWLASDVRRFPHQVDSDPGQRLADADLGADLLPPWQPQDPGSDLKAILAERFPHLAGRTPYAAQQAAFAAARAMDAPSLLLIEAPMGNGKTEIALAAAEVLAHRFGLGGIFVGLPTMATSDAMFARVRGWVDGLPTGAASTMFLAHGKAELNDDYSTMRHAAFRAIGDPDRSGRDNGAQASTWLQGRRKGVLANMVVGTIDQSLFAGLKVRHLALRHLALAGKVVVIDEVHAADVYMRQYLLRVLEWLGAYSTPVILLSATLPPAIKAQLLEAYAVGRGTSADKPPAEPGYPAVSVQGDRMDTTAVPWDGPRVGVRLTPLEDDLATLVDRLQPLVDDGACVAVVRNTVQRAQDTYDALVERLGERRVVLLHSRFVAVDRLRREKELRERLGPPSEHVRRPHGFVVVGTQVLEQSLDIDVDVMVSDVAPIDLVLQRIGRLHRHARADRPDSTEAPQLFLTGVRSWSHVPPSLDQGCRAVYGDASLLRTLAVLRPHLVGASVQLPGDIRALVDAAYDEHLSAPSGWEEAWREAHDELHESEATRHTNARVFLAAGPHADRTLKGWLQGRQPDGSDEQAAAQVRDGDDGIEVVAVQHIDGMVHVLAGDGPHAGEALPEVSLEPPADDVARALAGYTVRLPPALSRGARGGRVIDALETAMSQFTSWQRSRWLGGVLVLLFDDQLRAEVDGMPLRYDPARGLIVESRGSDERRTRL